MAFKTVESLDADTTISLGGFNKKTRKDNPTEIEGYYIGSKQVQGKTKMDNIHYFKTDKGNVAVWGKTDMDKKIASVPRGAMTRVAFSNMKPTKNGDMYVYTVQVDDENTIEVGAAPAPTRQAAASYDDGDDPRPEDQESDSDDESNDDEAEERQQTAALQAAERKAKLDALLKKPAAKGSK